MRSFVLDDTLTAGTTPTLLELRALALRGFKAVADLRMPDEVGAMPIRDERDEVAALGMAFLHIEVPARSLPVEKLDLFRREMAALPKPAFVHCTCGGRALLFSAMHLGLEVDEEEDCILRRIEGRGVIEEPALYEGAIRSYVRGAREPYDRLAQVIW